MDSQVFAGKYRTVRELSEEPSGRTWLAEGPGGVKVVVKVVHTRDAAAAAEIEHDVSLISGIRHPVLPTIFEWGHEGADFFLVREYVVGNALKLELSQQGRFAPLSVARYGAEAAEALAQIHDRGLLHGNVKTGNLIRTPADSIKLVGSSLSDPVPQHFSADAPAWMAHYLAPELIEAGPVTPATDVYAMGVVLYELLTGVMPFDGPTAASVADQQVHKPATSVRESSPDVPPALDAVVMRALEKAPEARFADGAALKAALDAVVHPPVPASALATGSLARPKSRWLWVLLAVVVVAAALVAAWLLGAFGGNEKVVPDVVGMSAVEASSSIAAAGLRVGSVTYSGGPVTGVRDGLVASQDPAKATRVDASTKVDLVLAGAQVVTVPNVAGMSEARALAALQGVGLAAGDIANVATTSATPGTVLTQDPAAGVSVGKGSSVALRIAQAPTAIAVPGVTTLTRSAARRTLENAGFSVSVVLRSSDTVSSGRVIEQDPSAGVNAQPGSTVTIVVSTGPASVAVPDVVGDTQATAVNALTAAGFKSRIAFQTGGGTVGTVVAQSPAAGTKAASGSTVVITVVK
jgi:beta-lactam-binding protein with PASTA domain